MDILKKFWPYSFRERTEVSQLVIAVIIYVVLGAVCAAVISLSGELVRWIPLLGVVLNVLFSFVGSLCSIYLTAGIVFTFLSYFKVLK